MTTFNVVFATMVAILPQYSSNNQSLLPNNLPLLRNKRALLKLWTKVGVIF